MTEIKYRSDMGVELVDHMGSDETVARAARVSTGNDEILPEKMQGLINYLVREGHTSTLEHCLVTFRVEVPIMVAREWMRHRTQSFNEISGRYAKLEPVFYVPSEDRPLVNAGSGAHPNLVAGEHRTTYLMAVDLMVESFEAAWEAYEYMTAGHPEFDDIIANEVARNVLPVSTYTRFYATANLNNWFKFLSLRNGEQGHPQYEIVEAAKKVEAIISDLYPLSYAAWKATREN